MTEEFVEGGSEQSLDPEQLPEDLVEPATTPEPPEEGSAESVATPEPPETGLTEPVATPELPIQRADDGIVTIVLTADNHLGYAAFSQQPRRRAERQLQLRRAFQQATDFALGQGVDLFIQAGDLFDSPHPDEHDRGFVAERLVELRQAGVRTFAVGGLHDTPPLTRAGQGESAPQSSFASFEALHYFPPLAPSDPLTPNSVATTAELQPMIIEAAKTQVGICGLSVRPGWEGDPLAAIRVDDELERAAIRLLVLHAPLEGFAGEPSILDARALVSRSSIAHQSDFQYILAGYHHSFQQAHIGQSEVIVAGATQHINFGDLADAPGFVFLGLAADGVRWCRHIAVDSLQLRHLVIQMHELWTGSTSEQAEPTAAILERLAPLCSQDCMLQLRLEGELTRRQYHQLDLNQVRRYGEEHCFALAIDDSSLQLLPEQESLTSEASERFSPREELVALADEWIAATTDEPEKKALRFTKEALLAALDDVRKGA